MNEPDDMICNIRAGGMRMGLVCFGEGTTIRIQRARQEAAGFETAIHNI